jgi:hypothetical protein
MTEGEEIEETPEEWVRSRPRSVQALIRRFPLCCIVRANRPLASPPPGGTGMVVSYTELGEVGVLSEDASTLFDTKGLCDPDWLEVVRYDKRFTPEWVEKTLAGDA